MRESSPSAILSSREKVSGESRVTCAGECWVVKDPEGKVEAKFDVGGGVCLGSFASGAAKCGALVWLQGHMSPSSI